MAATDAKKKCNPGADAPCPLRELLTRLGDKWSILVIHALARAPKNCARFSELRREINGISQRMLTATLRNLERDGILTREVFPVIPPRVEYTLTALGKDLLQPVQALVAWVEGNWSKIEKARQNFDAQNGKSSSGASNSGGASNRAA